MIYICLMRSLSPSWGGLQYCLKQSGSALSEIHNLIWMIYILLFRFFISLKGHHKEIWNLQDIFSLQCKSFKMSGIFLRVRAWGWWSRSPVAWGLSSLFHAQETGDLRGNRTGRSPHGFCCRLIGTKHLPTPPGHKNLPYLPGLPIQITLMQIRN